MNTMTDEELDRDWKPSGRRPQSTIARSFSAELMDIFRIENSVADLDEKVDKRKQQLNSQTSELEALEARIREMEERLKTQAPNPSGRSSGSPRTQRPPVANAFDHPDAPPPPPAKDDEHSVSSQQRDKNYGQHKYSGRRPGTARESQQAVPGALPPTPVGSEGECEPVRAPRTSPRSSAQARLGAIASVASSSSSSTPNARVRRTPGDDSGSVKSMSESISFADYVVVSRPDGDGEKDA
ncbi:hypothetical protein B0T16DRAFT_237216 [Cercophora newfieldiana]|uniref:Uncharacterized protein n=1 Tax=Cercophora newfieldiana TaxID=92897 RepID=A0AA40CHL1_9PEZI|nr:hypothetical protein B0T16DRAFT_237216 [Cercophora newfieldiana]